MDLIPEREQALLRANAALESRVSELTSALEAIRDSESRYRTLFERMDEGFSVCEVVRNQSGEVVDSRYLELNPALERLTGLSIASTVGRLASEVLPGVDAALFRTFEHVLNSGEPARFEAYVSALGRWYDTTAFPFGHDRFATLYDDITDRKRAEAALQASEERLRLIVQSVPDFAIFTITLDGFIESWNAGAQRMFGWSEDEALGQHVRILFTPEDCALGAAEAEMQQAFTTGRAADERWHVTKDGRPFYASGVLAPLRPGKHVRGYVKISRDLTERKRVEDELQFARGQMEQRVDERTAELRHANAALQTEVRVRAATEAQIKALFHRLISIQEDERRRIARDLHDQLGQQLTALRMNLEVFRLQNQADSAVLQQLERTQRLAEDIDRTIDFLTWQLRPEPLEHLGLAAALNQLVRVWSDRFAIEGAFQKTGDARLPSEIEENLYRIAQEALHNVVKHAEATRTSVLLEIETTRVTMTVEDNGCGFTSADNGDGRDQLGLVSMRERAELVGGKLEIDSSPDHGTTVVVRVPLN